MTIFKQHMNKIDWFFLHLHGVEKKTKEKSIKNVCNNFKCTKLKKNPIEWMWWNVLIDLIIIAVCIFYLVSELHNHVVMYVFVTCNLHYKIVYARHFTHPIWGLFQFNQPWHRPILSAALCHHTTSSITHSPFL